MKSQSVLRQQKANQNQRYEFFRSPSIVIVDQICNTKKLSRELNPDGIIILSEGEIP